MAIRICRINFTIEMENLVAELNLKEKNRHIFGNVMQSYMYFECGKIVGQVEQN
jgi:hypothetical protein